MKKTLCTVLALVMAISMSSCTKKNQNSQNGDVTTLTWYVNSNPLNGLSEVMEKVNEITEEKLNVNVDLKLIDDGAFSERLRMYMATDQKFDLCFTGYVNNYLTAVKNGGLLEISELIEKEAPLLKEAIPDYALKASMVDGELYAIPNMQSQALDPGLYLRKDIAEKYGLDKIDRVQSVDELEPYFDKMLADYPDMIPVNSSFSDDFIMAEHQKINEYAVINKNDPEHKVLYLFELPEYEKSLERANRWYKKGYIRVDYATAKGNMQADMKAGKYCGTFGSRAPGSIQKYESEYNREVHFISCADTYMPSSHILDAMTGISANSKNPEKAIKLLELVNTDKELLNLMQFGIEGKHYEKIDDKYIKIIDRDNYYLDAWKFGNTLESYLLEGQSENYLEETIKMNEESEKPVFLGYNVNTDPIKNEMAQCEAVRKEYDTGSLMTTSDYRPVLSELKSRLNEAGVDKIINEIQKQLDEWWKNNK